MAAVTPGRTDAEQGTPLLRLARAAGEGDTAATTQLLRLLAPEMARVVRGVLGPHTAELDDATQQALVALVHALPAFRGDCSPAGYACRIAFRTALSVRTAAKKRARRHDPAPDLDTMTAEPGAREPAEARRRMGLLRALLDELPPEQAEALCLRTVLGWSLDEIASASGVPLNTVRSRMRLAKEALRAKIEGNAELLEELGVRP